MVPCIDQIQCAMFLKDIYAVHPSHRYPIVNIPPFQKISKYIVKRLMERKKKKTFKVFRYNVVK